MLHLSRKLGNTLYIACRLKLGEWSTWNVCSSICEVRVPNPKSPKPIENKWRCQKLLLASKQSLVFCILLVRSVRTFA